MNTDDQPNLVAQLNDMQSKIDLIFDMLASPKAVREWYSVEETAKIIGKSEFTTRQWCNLGRINASKATERRGGSALWRISATELHRYKEEGLLPLSPDRNHCELRASYLTVAIPLSPDSRRLRFEADLDLCIRVYDVSASA